MRICVLSEYFYPDSTGGSGTVLSRLIRQLKDDNPELDIDVITSMNLFRGDLDTLPEVEQWDGINILRFASPQPRTTKVRHRLSANAKFTALSFRKLLSLKKEYDLVLVVTAPPTLPLAAALFSKLTGTPYVYLVYDLYLDLAVALNMLRQDSKRMRMLKSVQRRWLRSSSKVIVLGRCMREILQDRYQIPSEQIKIVPIPSSNDVKPMGKDTQFRRVNGLNGFVVLYAGNFARYQDFDTLLDAAKLLKERDDISFVFVGDGAKREHIKSRVESESLANVKMLPFVPEEMLPDMLASADVSLVTLEQGTSGLAVPSKFYNILASGRPSVVVVDSFSEIAHVVAEQNCGVRVQPTDSAQLASVLLNMADSPQLVDEMGQNARRVCEMDYAPTNIARQFYEIFREVVEMTPSRQSTSGIPAFMTASGRKSKKARELRQQETDKRQPAPLES